MAVAFLITVSARCDCGSPVVGRDRGVLIMLDTGGPLIDAADDRGPLDTAPGLDATHDAADLDSANAADHAAADAGALPDSASTHEAGSTDAVPVDSTAASDGAPAPDSATGPDSSAYSDAAAADAGGCATSCVPVAGACHACVDILIDNFCNTAVAPTALDVPADTTLTMTFVNRSVDYAADVWSSRGYGYIELPTGATWEDPIWHCTGPDPYTEYFDISIYGGGSSSCPGVRLNMDCQ